MHPIPGTPQAEAAPLTWSAEPAPRGVFSTRNELRGAIVAGGLLLIGFTGEHALRLRPFGLHVGEWLTWVSLGLGMVYGGRAAWASLVRRRFDIDVLMVVGAGFAASLGHPEEGALLLFLFVLSGALEDLAMQRTKREVEALHRLMPTSAIVLRGDAGAPAWVECDPATLRAGERIKIRPGDRAATDARVNLGATSFDQSAITGESLPRPVKPGDEIFAGTINTDDPIEAVVLRPATESSLQKILKLVTEAREQREPVQRLIDRLSEPYALGVLGVSLAVMVLWRFGLGRGWQDSVYTAITLLIVASPCALVIATPTATLSAIARAARAGVLFKGGQAIEQLAGIGSVCFDKTGTLTLGCPRLEQIHAVAWSDGERLLAMAAGLEGESSHPIAAAVREAAAARGIAPAAVTEHGHTAGRGVSGLYKGCPVRLGSYVHAEELIPVCFRAKVKEVLGGVQERGNIGVVVAHACPQAPGGGEAAVLILADSVRPGAAELVRDLHALGVKPVRMLTGDNRLTAERVAGELGLDRVDAEMLPEDKLAVVGEMKREAATRGRGKPRGVAVIGDGVNDAPALAAADVAVAIGSIGSDAALESADIVLLSDDLAVVPWAVRLARRARRTVAVNLGLALTVIVGVGALTLIGSWKGVVVPLWAGVLAHEGGTLLVVAHGLRLLLTNGPSPGAVAGRSAMSVGAGRGLAPAMASGPYTSS